MPARVASAVRLLHLAADIGWVLLGAILAAVILFALYVAMLFSCTSPAHATGTNIQTLPYTIQTSDCGGTVEMGIGSTGQLTVTLPAVTGFSEGCAVTVLNGDTGRGKKLSGFPANFTTNHNILWPRMSGRVQVVNGQWFTIRPQTRMKLGTGAFNVYSDYVNGDDSNDCLQPGSGNACKTAVHAMYLACNEFDFSGSNTAQTLFAVNLAAGVTDQMGIHYSCPSPLGAQGGGAIVVQGQSPSAAIIPSGASPEDAFGIYVNGTVQVRNLTIGNSTMGGCISVGLGAQLYILDSVSFNSCGMPQISVADGRIYLLNSYAIFGGAPNHFLIQAGGQISTLGSVVATFGANATFSDAFARAADLSNLLVPGWSYNLNSFTVTGTSVAADRNANIFTGVGNAKCLGTATPRFFPGSTGGAANTGSQCN